MKIKYYTLILVLLSSLLSGQLELSVTLQNSMAEITIYNKSGENYMFPLDRNHLRPYEKNCDAFYDYELNYPIYGLMTNIINSSGENVDYAIGHQRFNDIKELEDDILVKKNKIKKIVNEWGSKNNIKNFNVAYVNYSLLSNLVFIKPYEKISFKVKVDLYNITNQKTIYYNYILNKSENYHFYLSFCEYKNLDKYLTPAQKKQLNEYKFFYGKLKSNIIQLK